MMTDGDAQPTSDVNDEKQASLEASREENRGFQLLVRGCLCMVMLGIAGVGLLAALMPSYGPSHIRVTESGAEIIRQATTLFRVEHPDQCPSARQLVMGQYLDGTSSFEDSWGMSFRLVCDGRHVEVYSAGPDGIFDTADDVNR